MSLFEGIFSKLFENKYISPKNIFSDFKTKDSITGLLDKVINCKGEASALAYSETLMTKIENLNDKELLDFFLLLSKDYDFDNQELLQSVSNYADNNSTQNYTSMTSKFHSKRMEIFKNLNSIERGTIRLVNIRERLLDLIKENIKLKKVDIDLSNLFKNWFNRGFLVTHPITWDTSAKILEKIIKYEAVHEISSWLDLRNRLKPEDRRCYSFFHPRMEDEPLIFVEVALTSEIPSKIDDILDLNRAKTNPDKFKTAVFYSISNCQKGLKGISFGNFLLKQVVMELKKEFPSLETFVTLSPVPDFNKWLKQNNPTLHDKIIDKDSILSAEKEILNNSIEYFFEAKHKDGLPLDPVQRFHLSNGASLDKIHFMGNPSNKGIANSLGLMVNYKYQMDNLEKNHEQYFSRETISSSKSLLSKFNKVKKS